VEHRISAIVIGTALLALLAACSEPGSQSRMPESTAADAPGASSELGTRLAVLEHRQSLIEDANDIKRLQRAYGYYLDEALWDELTELFAEDGTIERGLDGVYVGKARIRQYLDALGGGQVGLKHGQLSEHMQLMPVVTVAPDGATAQARWRGIVMAGELGQNAIWGEGPYENEYIKEDGVWKLSKVHWFQSVVVPYGTGWRTAEDANGGKWVSGSLTPDRPSTIEYATWPSTYLPPFHFANPVKGGEEASARRMRAIESYASARAVPESRVAERAAVLAQKIQLLEDENEIENLQRIYGFYIDKGFWSEAADLFADDGTIEIGGSGVYVGKRRVLDYLRTLGQEYPVDGRLFERMQLQPIIHVSPDGQTARGRWRLFAQEAVHGEFANWGVGVYENEYVKDGGVWKISDLHLFVTMYTPYEDGWAVTALPNVGPSETLAPDRPPTVPHESYPAVFVAPFHYENPVTGSAVYEATAEDYAVEPLDSDAAIAAQIADLERRIGLLEDVDQLERMNAIYGYYLARNQWDNLAGIFSDHGSIEIAMRGVYEGLESVRRNLNLYGEAGIHHGLLHNHMQYQPVIHVAADGMSADMRSRAFSIMGQFEAYAMWMGGVYENRYVKEGGVWKIERDQVFNTYFVPYDVGWKDAVPRPPPGISESNPPDAPPTHPFEMYPTAFVPPFHYANPVTGNRVVWPPQ
jgi:hypothetical protein